MKQTSNYLTPADSLTANAVQVHCIPRDSKGHLRYRYHRTSGKFSFHHINAFETGNDTIVMDIIAADFTVFLRDWDTVGTAYLQNPAMISTIRRLVATKGEERVQEHDLRAVPGLQGVCEFAAQLPPEIVGRPHRTFFCLVCCISDLLVSC
jgi:carotenoid cleavage dioxygenase-like enzyme